MLEPAADAEGKRPWLRARAVWQLGRLASRQTDSRLIGDSLRGRRPALPHACHAHSQGLSAQSPADYLHASNGRPCLNDPSPAVRREALLPAARRRPGRRRSRSSIDLAKQYDGKDRFYLEAIGIAVGHHDKARRDVILADFDKEFPEWNDKVADLVWELRPPS